MNPLVVTYCNKFKETNHENTRRLGETLQNNDWAHVVLGEGETWVNYMTKMSAYRRHLETLPPDKIVIISDAHDMYCLRNVHYFVSEFKALNKPIVVSAEFFAEGRINHDPAHTFMNTGSMNSGRPAMGSWLLYGLGSQTENLPGFVVMVSTGKYGQRQPIAARQWHSGFLPGQYQGVEFRGTGDPVLYVGNPKGVDTLRQRQVVDAIASLNGIANQRLEDPEIATRVRQYELAFRMQTSVPELMDVSKEPEHIFDLYGTKGGDGSFASNCLLARRLAERGVRFIQLYHRDWDHHGAVKAHSEGTAKEVDQGVAALITDLKQRDMLKDTILVFGSEFGRTPMAQGDGRDHHLAGFTMWFAGGGFKPGLSYGSTDEFGYHAVENVVSVHDIHATLLHLLGIDYQRFSYKFQGLDSRLTGVEPCRVVHELFA